MAFGWKVLIPAALAQRAHAPRSASSRASGSSSASSSSRLVGLHLVRRPPRQHAGDRKRAAADASPSSAGGGSMIGIGKGMVTTLRPDAAPCDHRAVPARQAASCPSAAACRFAMASDEDGVAQVQGVHAVRAQLPRRRHHHRVREARRRARSRADEVHHRPGSLHVLRPVRRAVHDRRPAPHRRLRERRHASAPDTMLVLYEARAECRLDAERGTRASRDACRAGGGRRHVR